MPRLSPCSYSNCTKGYTRLETLTKSQVNHIYNYHKDVPATFGCIYTGRRLIFRRCVTNGMDYVCFCKSTITVRSNLKRHYELCRVAEAAVKAGVMNRALNLEVDDNSNLSGFVATSTNYAPLCPRPRASREKVAASVRHTKKARIPGPSDLSRQPPPQQKKPLEVKAYTQPPALDHMQYVLEKPHQRNVQCSSSHHNQPISSLSDRQRPVQSLNGTSTTYHQMLVKTLTDSKAREDYMMRETLATITQLTNQWQHLMEFVNDNHRKLLCLMAQQQSLNHYALSEQHRQLLGSITKHHDQVRNTAPHHRFKSFHSTPEQLQETRNTIEGETTHRSETGHSSTSQEGVPNWPTRKVYPS